MSTTKITLIHKNSSTTVGNIPWITHRLLNNFNIEPFDPAATYHPSTHVMVIDRYDDRDSGWHVPFEQNGFKLIVEYFWDSHKALQTTTQDRVLKICAREWIWINHYLMHQYYEYGYTGRPQTSNPDKFFLLLMNLTRINRDQLIAKVNPYLDDSLYSYRGRGIEIAGDYIHHDYDSHPNFVNQHFSNPQWYNDTNFSLVSESLATGIWCQDLYVSEKTFKPISLGHPFVIFGSTGTLDYLHRVGFKTFDHIIDESYDLVADPIMRLDKIVKVVDNLYQEFKQGRRLFSDTESQDRIRHNSNRFHNQAVVDDLWQTQVVDVIQEFVNV